MSLFARHAVGGAEAMGAIKGGEEGRRGVGLANSRAGEGSQAVAQQGTHGGIAFGSGNAREAIGFFIDREGNGRHQQVPQLPGDTARVGRNAIAVPPFSRWRSGGSPCGHPPYRVGASGTSEFALALRYFSNVADAVNALSGLAGEPKHSGGF